MKSITNKQNRTQKIFFTALIVVILIIGLIGIYVYALDGNFLGLKKPSKEATEQTYSTKPPTNEEKQAGDDIKKEFIEKETTSETSEGNSSAQNVDMSITTPSTQSGPTIQIKTLIHAATNDGTCTLTMTRNGNIITKTANIQALSSYSTCAGFSIHINELETGTWNVNIALNSNVISGNASQTLMIE